MIRLSALPRVQSNVQYRIVNSNIVERQTFQHSSHGRVLLRNDHVAQAVWVSRAVQ